MRNTELFRESIVNINIWIIENVICRQRALLLLKNLAFHDLSRVASPLPLWRRTWPVRLHFSSALWRTSSVPPPPPPLLSTANCTKVARIKTRFNIFLLKSSISMRFYISFLKRMVFYFLWLNIRDKNSPNKRDWNQLGHETQRLNRETNRSLLKNWSSTKYLLILYLTAI